METWAEQILLAAIGLSAGVVAAGGLFSFIVGLGVVSDFADRTHTGEHVMLYETSVALGGILGNLFIVYQISIPWGSWIVPIFGLFAGIFTGCWAMALAEILNVFPIFARRAKLTKGIAGIIIGIALGKGLGALLFFWQRW
ncbi:MAG TPA: stage V sporulation protein AB [Candidatus Dorea gallistercoris]|uniref:Stage V sporulation protein AB n=1 Tax=Candidatus Dorea gallistercoris TaxID=2838542 RepID=A0A9D1R9S9_9FIRM|nr:stage V sporulation protein AB [Candidatus Dorea gallistercoris]